MEISILRWAFPFFAILFPSQMALPQLKADFGAVTVKGCSPLLVRFNDLSGGHPTQWRWDLGNGTVSTLQNPSTTYFLPGQYPVSLVVTNSGGIDSVIKKAYITVYAPPKVDFSGMPGSLCLPVAVQFADSSHSNGAAINSWKWDFGDGSLGSGQHPFHVYTMPGTRAVTLEVRNSFGCVASVTRAGFIEIPQAVKADFANSVQVSCTPPVQLQFVNRSTGPAGLQFQWDFGGDSSVATVDAGYTYREAGRYTVRLTATSGLGCHDTASREIVVGAVVTDFTPAGVCPGSPVLFQNLGRPSPGASTWCFGDGAVSDALNPVKTYRLPGQYKVSLVNDYGACRDSVTRTVTVFPKPSFKADDTVLCSVPSVVRFSSNLPAGVSQFWDFGDGTSSADRDPSHTYTVKGNFTVKLVSGCGDTAIRQNYIRVEQPLVKFQGLPVEKCLPYTHPFSAVINSIEPVTSYQWRFGDGGISFEANPSHAYRLPGNYTITLITTTAGGCITTTTAAGTVLVGNKPKANFSASPRVVCAGTRISFKDLSTGNPTGWTWMFGDLQSSEEQHPVMNYSDTGYFSPLLVAKNFGCPDTVRLDKYIYIKAPVARFKGLTDCAALKKISFCNLSSGIDEWRWDFGDGTGSTERSPVHVYAVDSVYSVVLRTSNHKTGCESSKTQQVKVYSQPKGKPVFNADDTAACQGQLITFTISNVDAVNMLSYSWDFGTGLFTEYRVNANGSYSYRFNKTGVYSIRLITLNVMGCRDTIIKKGYIRVGMPVAGFGAAVTESCVRNPVVFNDSSYGIFPIVKWSWGYGDGMSETVAGGPFSHVYGKAGNYSVRLKVEDENGCSDSLLRLGYMTVSGPVAGFVSADTSSCPEGLVRFHSVSEGYRLHYRWDFGDGGTTEEQHPLHSYEAAGRYTVGLLVTDRYGCADSSLKKDYIIVTDPIAKFSMSDSMSSCPPFFVQFSNLSANYEKVEWDFGDGSSSDLRAPTHSFTAPGHFRVRLVVTGFGGCTDTAEASVVVKGPNGSMILSKVAGCDSLETTFTAHVTANHSFTWDFGDGNTLETKDTTVYHVYKVQGSYTARMILEDLEGCRVPVTANEIIQVYSVDARFSFPDRVFCDSGSVVLNDRSVSNDRTVKYNWDMGDGATDTAVNPVHVFRVGKWHPQLTVTSANGCMGNYKSPLPIVVVAAPGVDIAGAVNGCVPLQTTVSGLALSPDSATLRWHWILPDGATSDQQYPPSVTNRISGIYPVQLSATDLHGCKTTVKKNIEAFGLPPVNAGADTVVCSGRPVGVLATGAQTYSWSPVTGLSCGNCANPVVSPAEKTVYTVTGVSLHGCKASDQITVGVRNPFQISYNVNKELCKGDVVKLEAKGAFSYEWLPSTGLSDARSSEPVAKPDTTTHYRVTGTDDRGCFKDTGYVTVSVYLQPTVDAGPDKKIKAGNSLELEAAYSADVTAVRWWPSGDIFRAGSSILTVKPTENTEYTVEVTTKQGCRAADRVNVTVLFDHDNLFIPNAFSPNSDGVNDIFYPRGKGIFKIRRMIIFNRWGQVVFEKKSFDANDPAAGWDGTLKGTRLTPDVFVYTIEVMGVNGTILPLQGNITLIR